MKNTLTIIISTLFILFYCNTNKNNSIPKSLVSVHYDTLYQEIEYSIADSSEEISLEVYLSKLNKGVLHYRYKGNTPLTQQIPKLDSLFRTISKDTLINFDFNTLFWGRLSDLKNKDYTLAKRLALFAKKSRLWNKKTGRPVSGNKNDFIKQLKSKFGRELGPLLEKYNYKIESVSAEKVLVYPAEKLAFWNEIKKEVNAKDKLPFDCQLWFKLDKIRQ